MATAKRKGVEEHEDAREAKKPSRSSSRLPSRSSTRMSRKNPPPSVNDSDSDEDAEAEAEAEDSDATPTGSNDYVLMANEQAVHKHAFLLHEVLLQLDPSTVKNARQTMGKLWSAHDRKDPDKEKACRALSKHLARHWAGSKMKVHKKKIAMLSICGAFLYDYKVLFNQETLLAAHRIIVKQEGSSDFPVADLTKQLTWLN